MDVITDWPTQFVCGLQSWLKMSPTHLAPSQKTYMNNGDDYAPYNKPLGLIDFLENNPPEEEWLIILEPDMLFRQPILCAGEHGPEDERQPPSLLLPCKRGHPISAYSFFLSGCTNMLAKRYLPGVAPRNDTNGGQPAGRRADLVGGYYVVHKDDVKQYAHDWLYFTEHIRMDPDVRCLCLMFNLH
jgi:hypothetical protein